MSVSQQRETQSEFSVGWPSTGPQGSQHRTVADPRGRMIEAMLTSIGEQGYAATVVADVIAKAVASRSPPHFRLAEAWPSPAATWEIAAADTGQGTSASDAGWWAAKRTGSRRAAAKYASSECNDDGLFLG